MSHVCGGGDGYGLTAGQAEASASFISLTAPPCRRSGRSATRRSPAPTASSPRSTPSAASGRGPATRYTTTGAPWPSTAPRPVAARGRSENVEQGVKARSPVNTSERTHGNTLGYECSYSWRARGGDGNRPGRIMPSFPDPNGRGGDHLSVLRRPEWDTARGFQ